MAITPEILHNDIEKPVQDFRKKWTQSRKHYIKLHTGAHKTQWANAMIYLDVKVINIQVYLNFKKNNISDADFKLVSTHEFGQSVKSPTSEYPKNGPIDLMKYYDAKKSRADFVTQIHNTLAMEVDLKRLIWGAQIQWIR